MFEFMETDETEKPEPCPDRRVQEQEHELFTSIQSFHSQSLFHDVELCLEDKIIPAHRLVLASYSGFFKSMFTCEMKESYERQVKLQEKDYHNFSTIISYMYTSTVDLTKDNVEQLLKLSVLYQVRTLETICQKHLISCINEVNYVQYLEMSESLNCKDLQDQTIKFVVENFVRLAKQALFCTLPPEFLKTILSCKSLNVLTELQVYRALRSWMLHDATRAEHFDSLLETIRFMHIPFRHINVEIFNDMENMFGNSGSCLLQQRITHCNRLYHMKSENIGILVQEEVDTMLKGCSVGKLSRRNACKSGNSVYIFGGINNHQEYSDTYECYNVAENKWSHRGQMLSRRSASCAVYYQGSVVLAGGLDECHRPSGGVDVLCLATESWTTTAPMLQARSVFGMNALMGLIYAVGGHIGESYTTSVEVFDPIKEKWSNTAPLLSRHGCFSTVVLESCLYCMGGFSRSNVYDYGDIVERYDPRVGKWSYAAPLCSTRAAHHSVVIDSTIYVFGGTCKNGFKTDVEFFDPRKNEWCSTSPGPNDFSATCMGFGVVGDKIFIAGGRNPSSREHEAIDLVIEYDVGSNEWEYKEHMVEKRMFSASVTV